MYLLAEERLKQKYPQETEKFVERKKKVSQLKGELAEKGFANKGKKNAIVQLCKAAGIPLVTREKKIIPGWVGQPKGMLQVAFEQGMINPAKFDPKQHGKPGTYYTTNGHLDHFGNKVKASSLK